MDYPYVRVSWDGTPIRPDPVDIYTIHDWKAVEEAVRLYRPADVELFVHPDASLRFASEFVKELVTDPGQNEGYQVLNPGIAYCKADVFESLHPHVKALGDWAHNIGTQIQKLEAVVREMITKHSNAEHNIFPKPPPEAVILKPLALAEQIYFQVTGKRGLDIVASAAKRHMPDHPEKCTSVAEIKSSQPSEESVQTEVYRMNLQFLQEKLKLLGSCEEQVKKIHLDMEDLLLGNSSLGSTTTVMDFVDVDLMKGDAVRTKSPLMKRSFQSPRTKIARKTVDAMSPKTTPPMMKRKSPVTKTGQIKSPKKPRIE